MKLFEFHQTQRLHSREMRISATLTDAVRFRKSERHRPKSYARVAWQPAMSGRRGGLRSSSFDHTLPRAGTWHLPYGGPKQAYTVQGQCSSV